MILNKLYLPTILLIGFFFIQIFIDIYHEIYNKASVKFIFMLIFTFLVNILCHFNLFILAWTIVLLPFIYKIIITILVYKLYKNEKKTQTITDLSNNNIDLSNNNINLSTNNIHDIERVNRDNIRNIFYDKTDKYYNLNFEEKNRYDLSNNKFKYNIIDKLINQSVNNKYIEFIYNKQLFDYIIPKNLSDMFKFKESDIVNKNYNHMMKQFYIIDSNNYIPCPNNETKNSFFKKTGYQCYEINNITKNI